MKKAELGKIDKPHADSVDYDYYNAGGLQNNFNYIPTQPEKQCRGKIHASGYMQAYACIL